MTVLTLSDDQVRLLAGASTPVVVVDPRGKEVGKIHPVAAAVQASDDDEWAEAIRQREQYRKDGGKGFTT